MGLGMGYHQDNLSFGTLQLMDRIEKQNEKGDLDWSDIERQIREEVTHGNENDVCTSDVKFFAYPPLPPESSIRNQAPEDPSLVKIFMGNLRFEMTRATISWTVKRACGADLDVSNVLIHYKSSNGAPSPTGCASVFLPRESANALLDMNQRIFCGAKGIFVSLTSESMKTLLKERKIFDVADGRIRGPKHAIVIEQSRGTPNSSFSSGSSGAMPYRPPQGSPPPAQVSTAVPTNWSLPVYHAYPGPPSADSLSVSSPLVNPTEFFVGGICYEATPHFVAWMLSLSGIRVDPDNVTLFEDNKTGGKRGCAMVKVETVDFPSVRAYHHRLLCDSKGVYVADSPSGIPAFLRQQKASGEVLRGPSHAVVIEKRRAQATPPPSYGADLHSPPPYMAAMAGMTWGFPMGGNVGMPMAMPTSNPPAPMYVPLQMQQPGPMRTPPSNSLASIPPQFGAHLEIKTSAPPSNSPKLPEPSWKTGGRTGGQSPTSLS